MAESLFLNPVLAVEAAKIHDGMMVADFGAGSGFFTRAAARAVGESGRVWAVDIERELLSRIKNLSLAEALTNVEVIHGDIATQGGSNLPDHYFDLCMVANVLFATAEKQTLIAEIKRVLKRSGRALVIDWKGSFGGLGPHPDHVITEPSARALFEDVGFVYVEQIPAGEYHWGFVVRKKAS